MLSVSLQRSGQRPWQLLLLKAGEVQAAKSGNSVLANISRTMYNVCNKILKQTVLLCALFPYLIPYQHPIFKIIILASIEVIFSAKRS